jgi:hypothetical protein
VAGRQTQSRTAQRRSNRIGQREWERDTELKARRLLADGKGEDALRLLKERPRSLRTPTSALWLVEVDALLVVGENDRALAVLLEASASLDAAKNRRLEARAPRDVRYDVELQVRHVAIDERAGRLEESCLRAVRALELARNDRIGGSDFLGRHHRASSHAQARTRGRQSTIDPRTSFPTRRPVG